MRRELPLRREQCGEQRVRGRVHGGLRLAIGRDAGAYVANVRRREAHVERKVNAAFLLDALQTPVQSAGRLNVGTARRDRDQERALPQRSCGARPP